MTDKEKIILLQRYTYVCDTHLKNEYIDLLNNFTKHNNTLPYDTLNLYREKTRYEAYKEFCYNFEKILYGR